MLLTIGNTTRKKGREHFLELTGENICWLLSEAQYKAAIISWNDTRWIKKEKNGTLFFFRESSFSESIPLADFPADMQQEIMEQIATIANERQIRLVNFWDKLAKTA